MTTLKGENITLRAIEPEDLAFLFDIENNESFWEISHTQTPFSRFILKQYLENAHLDIYQAKQLRLIIQLNIDDKINSNIQNKKTVKNKKNIGMIDVFDFNPQHKRAGIGILIHPDYQQKSFASEALKLLINYCFTHLNLHQLYANIISDNQKSIRLFTKHNFKEIGIKKEWIFNDEKNKKYKDEILYQLINK